MLIYYSIYLIEFYEQNTRHIFKEGRVIRRPKQVGVVSYVIYIFSWESEQVATKTSQTVPRKIGTRQKKNKSKLAGVVPCK